MDSWDVNQGVTEARFVYDNQVPMTIDTFMKKQKVDFFRKFKL